MGLGLLECTFAVVQAAATVVHPQPASAPSVHPVAVAKTVDAAPRVAAVARPVPAPAPAPLPAAILLHAQAAPPPHAADALPKGELPARDTFLHSPVAAPEFRAEVDQRLAVATPEQRRAIASYTNKSTELVRDAERLSPEAYVAKWTSAADQGRKLADDIEAVLHTATPTPGIVYRGMSKVPSEVVAEWLKKGAIGIEAVTSTTFDPDIAIKRFAPIQAGGLSVVMVLHEKSGVAVETLAFEKDEHEVLLAKGTSFRITGASTTGDRVRIDAEEN